jgi:predicted phosphodiesterase
MSFKWRPEEEHLLRSLMPYKTRQEISHEINLRHKSNIPGFVTERTEAAIRRKCLRDNITIDNCRDYENVNEFAEISNNIEKLQLKFKEASMLRNVGLLNKDEITRKYLVLSDIHFPYARMDYIKQILSQHRDATGVILNGDLINADAAGSYGNAKRIPLLIEYILLFKLVKFLSENFEHVAITLGNHDVRVSTMLSKKGISRDASQVLGPDLLARIANGEELDSTGMLVAKHDFDNVIYQRNEPWYIKIGKTIIAHPWNKGSSKPGFTVEKLLRYFSNRYNSEEFDSIVVGHCFDDQTEILTTEGWKGIDQISKMDTVGTMNLKNSQFEWDQPTDVWKYSNHKEIIKFGQEGSFQIAVTPEHGMVWQSHNDNEWRLNQAQEIAHKNQIAVPTALVERDNMDWGLSDDQLRLIAWVAAEGSISNAGYIRLHQSDDENGYVQHIDDLLFRLGIEHSKVLGYKANTTTHGTQES